MAEPKSANVFFTKSFWMPAATWAVGVIAAKVQPWFVVSDEAATVFASVLAWGCVAIVRRVTNRPAHFRKGQDDA